ncbi:MAG: 2,3,4,5-tetrahydropyridine-2,6-dicarboxylate N-succinyltransferase, partial [Gemmatimonadaceae bacterium]
MSASTLREIEKRIDALSALAPGANLPDDAREVVGALLDALEAGSVRAAEEDQSSGVWRAVPWVKRGILLGFRAGGMIDMSINDSANDVSLAFFDKDTYPPRRLNLRDGIRIVPGGSSIRRGAYVAAGVVCMPPMYINVGAHVGAGTMIDSHALVGSCAQVGERVHLSAAAQL